MSLCVRGGKFRRFAFVGYRTAKEAEAAVSYFHDTYIDTSKIEVHLAKSVCVRVSLSTCAKASQGVFASILLWMWHETAVANQTWPIVPLLMAANS